MENAVGMFVRAVVGAIIGSIVSFGAVWASMVVWAAFDGSEAAALMFGIGMLPAFVAAPAGALLGAVVGGLTAEPTRSPVVTLGVGVVLALAAATIVVGGWHLLGTDAGLSGFSAVWCCSMAAGGVVATLLVGLGLRPWSRANQGPLDEQRR